MGEGRRSHASKLTWVALVPERVNGFLYKWGDLYLVFLKDFVDDTMVTISGFAAKVGTVPVLVPSGDGSDKYSSSDEAKRLEGVM